MSLYVQTIVRNEADRHLVKMMDCCTELGAIVLATDDNSTDETPDIMRDYGAQVRVNDGPSFWEHEAKMRQAHLDWCDSFMKPGDWVLALDGDETISCPQDIEGVISGAENLRCDAVTFRLHEFWTPTEYRVDGFWFGTRSPIMYRWQPGGRIPDREMGCGREPVWVRTAVAFHQETCDWLHWGYVRAEDRVRKHKLYSERIGGHGHANSHIDSIITEPMLRTYTGG